MSGLVIVADSDPLTLQRRSSSLEQAGRRVLSRPLGKQLIQALGAQSIDCIVIGFGEDNIDLGLCRAVRSHVDAPILLTGPNPTLEDVEGALGAGADDFMIAPSSSQLNRRVMMWRQSELRGNLEERRAQARKRVEERKNGGGAVEDLESLLGVGLDLAAMPDAAPFDEPEDDFLADLRANDEAPAPKPAEKPKSATKPKSAAKRAKKPKGDDDPTERVWR